MGSNYSGPFLTVVALFFWSALPVLLAILLLASGPFLIFEGVVRWCPLKALLGLGRQYNQR